MVKQAAGRRNNDVDAGTQGLGLRRHADATINDGGLDRQILAVGAHAVFDLCCEFARRRQDQHARLGARLGRAAREQLQYRQREAGGLAGAGLRSGHQVMPAEHDGNRLCLDWCWCVVTLFGNGAQNVGGQAEIGEMHVELLLETALRAWGTNQSRQNRLWK